MIAFMTFLLSSGKYSAYNGEYFLLFVCDVRFSWKETDFLGWLIVRGFKIAMSEMRRNNYRYILTTLQKMTPVSRNVRQVYWHALIADEFFGVY